MASTAPLSPRRKRAKAVVGKWHHHSIVIVQHNYHDHAQETPEEQGCHDPHQRLLARHHGAADPFPIRLHRILDAIEADGYSDVVAWQPHGRCFVVKNPAEFKNLVSKYFNLSKMTSFQRQLNLYGFQRITQGMDKGGYYHELFLRGKLFLAHQIVRTRVKGTKVRARSNPTQEPDFWAMPWIPAANEANKDESSTTAVAAPVAEKPASHGPPAMTNRLFSPNPAPSRVNDMTFVVSSDDEEGHDAASCWDSAAPTITPASVNSSTPTNDDDTTSHHQPCDTSSSSTCTLLCGWGKNFYALDSLPPAEGQPDAAHLRSVPELMAEPDCSDEDWDDAASWTAPEMGFPSATLQPDAPASSMFAFSSRAMTTMGLAPEDCVEL